jgi:PAS domain S-box-containing protein
LIETEQHYKGLVENSRDLICTHDLNGVLLTVNLAAAQTLGYDPGELVNRSLRELLRAEIHPEVDAYLATLREHRTATGFIELWTKSGETRIWKYTSTLRTEGVDAPFVQGMAHDYTEILQAQREIREGEERLRVAAEVGKMYAWEWNPVTDEVRRSAECADILGLKGSVQEDTARDYFVLIHPDDREMLWKLATSLSPENPAYRTEYRRYRPDGTLVWLQESGRATFDKSGKMTRLIGMTADITERRMAEGKLRESEERIRRIVQKCPVAMLVTDVDEAKNELVNDKFTALFGYSVDDIPNVAQWWTLAYPDAAYRAAVALEWRTRVSEAVKNRSEIAPMEAKVCCKDGSYRYIEFHFASLGETNLVSFVDLTDHKNAQQELAKVGGRLIDAQEKERTRIARDLHDDVCQRLALLAIELERLGETPLDSRTSVRKYVGKLKKRVSEILSDVEAISHELHSSKLELLGLNAAVRSLCREFAEDHKMAIDFVQTDIPDQLPKDVATCLFRVAQEALRNCVRHSKANRLQVRLSSEPDQVRLSICDDGIGFDPETAMNCGGLGLISMRERITLVNGTIAICSKQQGGTEILCKVPFESEST